MLSSDWLMKGVILLYQFLVFSAFPPLPGYCIQIYHVWEGYLRKIPVERRTIFRAERRGKFSLKTGGKLFVSRLVFFANTPPKHDISV